MLNKKIILNSAANDGEAKTLTEKEQVKLKRTLLDIVKEIDCVCNKHGIKVFLVGGSLLGAVRHNGFIPWDDDIDLGMIREDYIRFRQIFDSELGDKYFLRCPNSRYPNSNRFMQIFKKGTIMEKLEGSTPLQPNCVSIDIFPYDYAPNNLIVRGIKGCYCNGIMLIASAVTEYKYPNQDYKNMMMVSIGGIVIYFVEKIIGFIFSWRSPEKWFNTVDNIIQSKKKTKYITSATGRRHYLGEVFPTNILFPLKKIHFENLTLYAPAVPDIYLRHNYGKNYMSPPVNSLRESHFVKHIEL